MRVKEGYSFDDLLYKPLTGVLESRSNAKLQTQITSNIFLNNPLISMSMDTVTEDTMAIEMAKYGGLGIVHRQTSIENQVDFVKNVKNYEINLSKNPEASLDKNERLLVGAAIGLREKEYLKRAEELIENGSDLLVMDIPHADMEKCIYSVEEVKKYFPETDLMVGNVATYHGFKKLAEAGADAIKVGIGNGSICKTRIVTGCGVPQMSAIFDCVQASKDFRDSGNKYVRVISEGGTKNSGDVMKALVAGCHGVIIGSQFAGTDEAPGEIVEIKDEKGEIKKYKKYWGMASQKAQNLEEENGKEYSGKKPVPEGVESLVEYKGLVKDKIEEICGGLRSGISFLGGRNLFDVIGSPKVDWVKISSAGLRESYPHDVIELKDIKY